MEGRIKRWKATIRPAKKLQQWLNDNKWDQGTLREAVAIPQCQELKWDVREVMSGAATGSTLNSSNLRLALSVVIISLLYHLWQRPSAASEATIAEFEAAQRISDDETGKSCWIMTVARHKTALEGPANITMSAEDYRGLQVACLNIRK